MMIVVVAAIDTVAVELNWLRRKGEEVDREDCSIAKTESGWIPYSTIQFYWKLHDLYLEVDLNVAAMLSMGNQSID